MCVSAHASVCLFVSLFWQLKASLVVHLFGAYLAFFVGLAYFWVQLWLTYKAEPSQDRRCVGPLRASLCSLCTLFLIGSILTPVSLKVSRLHYLSGSQSC